MNIFRWHKATAVTVKVITRQATKLRLSEWRADKALCVRASKLMDDSTVQLMVSVLHNEHPAFVVIDPRTPLDDRAIFQARCEGYTMALANLEAMASHQPTKDVLEPEFAPEEVERH